MMMRTLALFFLAITLTGCGSVHFDNVKMVDQQTPVATKLTPEQEQTIQNLQAAIKNLGPGVSQEEATLLAYDSVVYSMVLANKYDLTYPPLWHNVLVNSKKRPRGLCYHWQRDLMTHFKSKNLKTVDLKEGVAYEKDYWREHNVMVATAKGQPFESGIIFDPWRKSGKLIWARVTEDHYPWKLRVWKDENKAQVTNNSPALTPASAMANDSL